MDSKRYPLQAAHSLRHGEQLQAEGALGHAVRAVERAHQARAEALRALGEHLAAASLAAGDGGEPGTISRAIDVQRSAAFAQRAALTTRRLRATVEAAEVELAQAHAVVTEAQQALARAHGRAQAIDRDRARFELGLQRSAREAEWSELEEQQAYRKRER